MEIINKDHPFLPSDEIAATIGFFDGVHTGHRFLIEQLKTEANARKMPAMIITFLQQPQSILQHGFQPELLNSFNEKIEHLALSGIDYCLPLNFTRLLSKMNAKDFIQKKLKKEWHVKLLIIGYDNHFGKKKAESFEDYVKYGNECGIETMIAKELPNFRVSSTHIRNCLLERNIKEANHLLSYHYRLEGKIVEGDHWGKKIDFPTANLELFEKNKIIPGEGAYATWVFIEKTKFAGMVYIGKRPTVSMHGKERIEVHLFNFSGNLYDQTLQLDFVDFLRESRQFGNLEELKKQLVNDKEMAMKILFSSF